jgi:two-component system cell cycle response regulator
MGTRVLVVDDTLEAVQLLSIMLQANDFEPVTAMTHSKALRLAREAGVSAVLLDLLMPDMDGLEICRRLRANPATANLAIIIVTAVNEPGVETRAKAAGADGLIYKPIEMPDLIAKLRESLAGRDLS